MTGNEQTIRASFVFRYVKVKIFRFKNILLFGQLVLAILLIGKVFAFIFGVGR